ncbi:importin-13 isoform X2 [Lethenteron reissneri]|uniref:importin-13 isoform X2 n=1 Tax=Lethenteron reissneri TaxID=7753 RepID=UPI002AB61CA8|nr:importin-13 isoform X2 [Lethenteron reissneri]
MDAEVFTADTVEKALHQLYYDPAIEHKNAAQKWLMQAQVSPDAWHFSWVLLGSEKASEIQYFGASALHTKISRYWADIPSEQYEALKSQLSARIAQFADGPKMVLTRLCVALASLALNTLPDAWPTAVSDMTQAFPPGPALLELLTVLPEELQTSRLAQHRKGVVRGVLAREAPACVFPLLLRLLEQGGSGGAGDGAASAGATTLGQKVLRCFASWVQLDVPLTECEGLVHSTFRALRDAELFDTAVDALVQAISQPDAQRYVNTLLKLIPQVLQLQEQLTQAVQNGDTETTHGICRVIVALGENHARALLEQTDHWQSFLALVNMVMYCTGIPGHYPVDETTSCLTLTFWYTLQDDITSLGGEKQAMYLQMYRPVYFQLVDVLLYKAQFPTDAEYASWSADEKEQFRIYRVDISDTLMYVYEMLGPELLSNLYDKLGRLLTATGQPPQWQQTEAFLYGFQSIAETLDVNDSDVIPGLIGLIPRITVGNVQLADTIMFTIGALAEWLADHPVMLTGVLPLVLQALANPELSISSVSTLKKLCRECKHDLGPYAPSIMAVSQEVLVKQIHKSSQCMWLMQALGLMLSPLPVAEILGHLQSLLTPHIQQLESLAEQPVVVVLQQVFQLVQKLLAKWINDSHVVEAVCTVFIKSVKTLLDDFGPMIPQLSEMLGQMYSTVPQASALELTRELVLIFCKDIVYYPTVKALFLHMAACTLTIFHRGPRDHPDIVDSFMQLLSQALRKKPDVVVADNCDIKALFQCGLISLKFPEGPTVKSACGFFTELLPHCATVSAIGQVVHENGRLLLQTVLEAIGGQAPRNLMDNFAEVLFCVNKHCFAYLPLWLKEAMARPDFPSSRVTHEQKDIFGQQILRERVNKRKVKEMVKEFTLLCRGLHGTEYAAEY